MNPEEIAEEIFDIMQDSNYVEEPAGHDCGYGFTEDGQAEILAIIKRIMPQIEKDMIMISQTKYNVDIDERNDVFCTEQNRIVRSNLEERFNGRISASNKLAAVLLAYGKCDKKIKDLDMVEVKVDGVNFPG